MNESSADADDSFDPEEPTSAADLEFRVGNEPEIPTPDANIMITIGTGWRSLSQSRTATSSQLTGMAFNIPGPGLTLWLGANADLPIWLIIAIAVIQVFGFVALTILPKRHRR